MVAVYEFTFGDYSNLSVHLGNRHGGGEKGEGSEFFYHRMGDMCGHQKEKGRIGGLLNSQYGKKFDYNFNSFLTC